MHRVRCSLCANYTGSRNEKPPRERRIASPHEYCDPAAHSLTAPTMRRRPQPPLVAGRRMQSWREATRRGRVRHSTSCSPSARQVECCGSFASMQFGVSDSCRISLLHGILGANERSDSFCFTTRTTIGDQTLRIHSAVLLSPGPLQLTQRLAEAYDLLLSSFRSLYRPSAFAPRWYVSA